MLLRDSSGRVLCDRLRVADTPLARARGLLGRRGLEDGEGLLLRPAGSIHTAFMRFSIDAVFLDSNGVVLHVAHDLHPWKVAGKWGARAVIELARGEARRHGFKPGLQLELRPSSDGRPETTKRLPPRPATEVEPHGSAVIHRR